MKVYESPYTPVDPRQTLRNFGVFIREQWTSYPHRTFTDSFTGETFSGNECAVLSEYAACRLLSLGVAEGDLLAFCARSSVRIPLLLVAAWSVNAAAIGLTSGWSSGECVKILANYEPKVIVCDKDSLEMALEVRNKLDSIKCIILLDDDRSSQAKQGSTTSLGAGDISKDGSLKDAVHTFADIFGRASNGSGGFSACLSPSSSSKNQVAAISVKPELMAYLAITSGTTGTPKAAMHTHRTLMGCVLTQGAEDVMPWPVGTVVMATSAIQHSYCLVDAYCTAAYRGYSFVLAQRPGGSGDSHSLPRLILRLLREYRVHTIFTTPSIVACIAELFRAGDARANAISNDGIVLRYVITATDQVVASMVADARRYLPTLQGFGNLYGQTEAPSIICHQFKPGFSKFETLGRVLGSGKFRIVNPETLEDIDTAGDGSSSGELWIQTLSMVPCYYKNPEATEKAFTSDGWYRTGDICTVDADGYVTLVDRLKGFIKTKDNTVYPAAVEARLREHPAIRDVAVLGLPHPTMQKALHALVVTSTPCTEREICEFLKERAPAYFQLEAGITFCKSIPRNELGKIVRNQLIQLVSDKHKSC